MSLNKFAAAAVITGVAFGLVGCGTASKKTANDPFMDSSAGIKPVSSFYGEHMSSEEELGLLNKKVVYFAYDNSDLTNNDERLLKVHAKYLLDNPKFSMHIAGHTDNRGSREYNIALGERRAKAVAKFLEMHGIASNRLIVVSYGKEQPIDSANNEQAWAKNRRAELSYESAE